MAVSWLTTGLSGWTMLLAQAPLRGAPPANPDPRPLLWQYLLLLVVALAGVVLLYAVARWRKRAAQDRLSSSDQLSEFRTLYEQGQITQEEFDRLRGLLGQRMRREVERRAEPQPPAAAKPAPSGPETPPPDGIQAHKPE
jgi:hypothetical protein